MKNLLDKGTKCLIVQSKFSAFSFWNYIDVCKLVGAKYPAAPLGLMTVAALLPQQWDFKLLDENVEPLLDEHFAWADIVCTGGMLPQQQGMLSVIDKAHEYGCPAVIGGPDPTSQPHLYQTADYLVHGEGEITIPMFIEALERGEKSGEYNSPDMADMTQAVIPRFDLIRFKDYIQVGVQYSRGCPFNCEFCDIIELYGRKPRTKTPEQVISEFQSLYELGYRGHLDFVDDNFIGNKRNVKQVLPVIYEWSKKYKNPFFFTTEASINLADDDQLLEMMKKVDFRFVFVGIETSEDDILKAAQKKQNMNKPLAETIKKIYKYGIIVNAGFIIGFDEESDLSAELMIKAINEPGIAMAMLGLLYALPNTQLTRRLHKEGRLFVEDNDLKDCDNVIDQATSGLNFLTTRPRIDILNDFNKVLENIYAPKNYFKRIVYTGLHLEPSNLYKPNFVKVLKTSVSFMKVCAKLGFNRTTGWLYWKMILTVLFKNPKALEASINLSAMFIHFYKQSRFVVELTKQKINYIKSYGEEKYNKDMLEPQFRLSEMEEASKLVNTAS